MKTTSKIQLTVSRKFETSFELEIGKDISKEQYELLVSDASHLRDHHPIVSLAEGLSGNWRNSHPSDDWVDVEVIELK